MAEPIRIAVVGGGIRGSMYAQVVVEHPSALLVGFAEPSQARAEALRDSFGVATYPDLATLLNGSDGVDAVIIATPDHLHLTPGLTALEAGLHVLFEKPLATTTQDSAALLACARPESKVAVGFENRWHPRFQAVRTHLRSHPSPIVALHGVLQDTDFVPRTMLPWAAQSTPGWFLMPHSLDMAMWISQAEPTEVFARGTRKILVADGIDTFDRMTASFAMSDGAILTLESGWVLPAGRPAVFQFRFGIETLTDHFEVEIDRSGITHYTADKGTYMGLGGTDLRGRLQGSPIEMTKDFIDWCLGADIEMPDLNHGHLVTRAIAAAHRSLTNHSPIAIP